MSTSHAERHPWRPKDTLAHRVLLVRTELGLSQREAAMKSGVSYGTLQGVEAGRSPRNELTTLKKFADAFSVDRDWLTWGGPLDNENGGGNGTDSDVPLPVTREYRPILQTVSNVTNGVVPLHSRRRTTKPQRSDLTMVG